MYQIQRLAWRTVGSSPAGSFFFALHASHSHGYVVPVHSRAGKKKKRSHPHRCTAPTLPYCNTQQQEREYSIVKMASLNDIVPAGVVTGDDLLTLLEHARANGYAIPAVNCTRYVHDQRLSIAKIRRCKDTWECEEGSHHRQDGSKSDTAVVLQCQRTQQKGSNYSTYIFSVV